MNESPVLGGVHTVDDIASADDFSKKHMPFIGVERDGDQVTLTVEVGHYVGHPNLPDHWIEYIAVMANGAPIMEVDFAAGVVAPTVVAKAMLDPGTPVSVFERCNLHGVWSAETTV
jgi:desulfoferrodoxin-like iron-binding protein